MLFLRRYGAYTSVYPIPITHNAPAIVTPNVTVAYILPVNITISINLLDLVCIAKNGWGPKTFPLMVLIDIFGTSFLGFLFNTTFNFNICIFIC